MIPFRPTQVNRFLPPPPINQRQMPGGMGGNPFGVNMQIPGIPQPPPTVQPQNQFNMNPPQPPTQIQQPTINQPERNPVDFASEYAKITGNRPNRLAYQQSVEQGPQQIQRGKLAKLGALIAAAGGSMGPGGAQAGMNLGLSAYQEPQRRADELFERRNKGLGNLATMEDSDVQNQIRALEARHSDWYKQREDARQQAAEGRATDVTAEQVAASKAKREQDKWLSYEDEGDGNTYLVHRETGEKKLIGHTGQTTPEMVSAHRQKIKAEEEEREPGNKSAREYARGTAWGTASIGAGSRERIADKNNTAKIRAKQEGALKSFKPDDQARQVWVDLMDEFAKDEGLAGLDLEDYVDIKQGPGGMHIIETKPTTRPTYGGFSSEEDNVATLAIKQKIRKVISDSIARSKTPGVGTGRTGGSPTPSTALPPGFTIK